MICTATIEEGVPRFLKDSGSGCLGNCEYSMLPKCANERIRREVSKGSNPGVPWKFQRLINTTACAVIDLEALGERSILIDCDVIQADGGTRTTSITGGMIVLYDAVRPLMAAGKLTQNPIRNFVSCANQH